MRRLLLPLVLSLAAAVGLVASDGGSAASRPVLVALRASAPPSAAASLQAAGAQPVSPELRLWRVRGADALVGRLQRRGDVLFSQPERTYAVAATSTDPLLADEWWRAQVGIDGLTPPGPGIPVTVVDSGLDLQHPEFAGRVDTQALNPQEPAPLGGEHGTMVSSLIAAPENGIGMVGIYPQAVLRSWDTALGEGTKLDSGEIVNGVLAAARSGRGVINLSLGGDRDLAVEYAIDEAVARGSLVVAASGNEGGTSNQQTYPAILPHVLTVGATNRAGQVSSFSSTSPYVDLVAPGEDVTVASAVSNGWVSSSGTSFSTPIVSGAAAWVWTVRPDLTADQVAEVLRRSATDLIPAGRDAASGFGMLDVAAALASQAPVADVQEPNDDTDEVAPSAERNFAHAAPLLTRTVHRRTLSARLDRYEDPRDVYRVWLPARLTLTATATASSDVDLAVYRDGTPSAVGAYTASYRLGRARTRGTAEKLVLKGTAAGRWAYLVVSPGAGTVDSTYRLALTTR